MSLNAPQVMRVFNPEPGDDFAAYNAACKWLQDMGYSVGRMQRGAPTAAWIGDCDISKWRNLSEAERDTMDAMIHDMGRGRFRGGAVEVAVYTVTPAMDAWLASQAIHDAGKRRALLGRRA
jgi:hypothetical protein